MAFADFNITADGIAFLARSVEDAQQGTRTAHYDRMDFGRGNVSNMLVVWRSCTTSLRIASYANSVTFSGIVDNRGDTLTHGLNRIEVWGHLDSGISKLLAWSLSETTETIPTEDEQLVTRRCVVQVAMDADASVTITGAMSGYASEDDVVLTAPHHTRGGLVISDASDSAYVAVDAVSDSSPELAELRIANGVRTGKLTASGRLYVGGADETATPQGYSGIDGGLMVTGALDVGSGMNVSGDIETTSCNAYIDGDLEANTGHFNGNCYAGNFSTEGSVVAGSGTVTGKTVVANQGLSTMRLVNIGDNQWKLFGGVGVTLSQGSREAVASYLASHAGVIFIGGQNPQLTGTQVPLQNVQASVLFVLQGETADVISERMRTRLPDRFDGVGFSIRALS